MASRSEGVQKTSAIANIGTAFSVNVPKVSVPAVALTAAPIPIGGKSA